jgi:hypothetical protein
MATNDKGTGLGDDQGTRIGAPDSRSGKPPAPHSDAPTGRPERVTGNGAEATQSTDGTAEGHDHEHGSAYGGEGGAPKQPNG